MKALRALVAAAALVGGMFAQSGANGGSGDPPGGEVPPGIPEGESWWSDGAGGLAKVEVTDNPAGGVWVTVTTAGGFTSAVSGIEGANTSCWDFDGATTPSGEKFRGKNGKLQKKGPGGYRPMKQVKKPKTKSTAKPRGSARFTVSSPVVP